MSRKLSSVSALFAVILLVITVSSPMAQRGSTKSISTVGNAGAFGLNLPTPMSNPTFDATGLWKSNAGDTMEVFQEKDEVNAVFVNQGWAHRLAGRYVSPTKIRMTVIRRTRTGGCEMTMDVDLIVNSANSLSGTGVASETACGIAAGSQYPTTWTRIL
jgi:hypothetical protein